MAPADIEYSPVPNMQGQIAEATPLSQFFIYMSCLQFAPNTKFCQLLHGSSIKSRQDQGDLCRSPRFYFDLDFILRKF